jgi:hypothetical protein
VWVLGLEAVSVEIEGTTQRPKESTMNTIHMRATIAHDDLIARAKEYTAAAIEQGRYAVSDVQANEPEWARLHATAAAHNAAEVLKIGRILRGE